MSKNQNVETVRAIGKGVRLTETAVPAIVALAPEGFDPNKRGAVADLVHTWAGFPNKENRPAVATGGKGSQRPTDYGTGHDTLVRAVKKALSGKKEEKVTLKGVLTGENGGSVTLDMDSDLGKAILKMIQAAQG